MVHKFVLILSGKHSSSHEKKVAKFLYFLATTMYECSIFLVNMIVRSNLAVNSVLFRLKVMPGRFH